MSAEPDPCPPDTHPASPADLRADLCEVATRRCYRHGSRVVDDILRDFHVTRKTIKEKR